MISFCSLLPVGLGWGVGGWGGVNNIPLDIHLHDNDDLFLLIASTVPSRVHSRVSRVYIRVARVQQR